MFWWLCHHSRELTWRRPAWAELHVAYYVFLWRTVLRVFVSALHFANNTRQTSRLTVLRVFVSALHFANNTRQTSRLTVLRVFVSALHFANNTRQTSRLTVLRVFVSALHFANNTRQTSRLTVLRVFVSALHFANNTRQTSRLTVLRVFVSALHFANNTRQTSRLTVLCVFVSALHFANNTRQTSRLEVNFHWNSKLCWYFSVGTLSLLQTSLVLLFLLFFTLPPWTSLLVVFLGVCLFLHCFPKPVWWWCFWGVFFILLPQTSLVVCLKKYLFTLLPQTSPVVVGFFCFVFYTAPPNQSGGGVFGVSFLHCSPKPVWWWCFWCIFFTLLPQTSLVVVFLVCVCCCFYTAPPNQLGGGGVLHWVNEVAVSIVSIHTCKLPQLQNAFMAHNTYNRILHCTLCFCKVDLIKNSEFQCRNTKNRTQTWKGSMSKKGGVDPLFVFIWQLSHLMSVENCVYWTAVPVDEWRVLCLFDTCHTWWSVENCVYWTAVPVDEWRVLCLFDTCHTWWSVESCVYLTAVTVD